MPGFWNDGSSDPINPYLGVFGGRRLIGRARGSPAGFPPQQARDVSPFALTRERVQEELDSDPRLRRNFDANTTAEVGTDPAKRRWYQALTIDRAVQSGKPLSEVVNAPDYYPPETTRQTATTGLGTDPSIWTGDNPANFATGNASYDPKKGRYVGFAGGPQTTSYGLGRGAEYGGIEGQAGLPYARAMGYTGPDRTAIGPAGPTGNDDQLTAGLSPSDTPREASYPAQDRGRKMPSSLMDFLNPDTYQAQDRMGRPTSIGDALSQNSNAMMGMGLGLLQMQPLGGSGFANALQGYQSGAALDQRQQALREAADQRKQAQSNWEKQFARSDPATAPTDFTRAARDLGLTPGTPEHAQFAKQFYQSKSEGNLAAQAEQRQTIAKNLGLDVTDPKVKGWLASGGQLNEEGKALPAELASRSALSGKFLDEAPAIRAKIESGMATDSVEGKIKTYLNIGDQGELARKVKSGSDALLRSLTGAGMSIAEAQRYVSRYELQPLDTTKTALSKFDQLRDELSRMEQEAYRGRGGVPREVMDRRRAMQAPGGDTAAGSAKAAAPKVGTVEDGFVFKGGDPSKSENWAPVR